VLLVGFVVYLSAHTLITEKIEIETYLDESVQGLSVGSSVYQRGVQVGTVKRIMFVPEEYSEELDQDTCLRYGKYVMVVIDWHSKHFQGFTQKQQSIGETIEQWVVQGLRLKLVSQGITGMYYLEADYVDPLRYPPMDPEWTPHRYYIPSAPSLLSSFTSSADTLLQSLQKIDYERAVTSFQVAMQTITQGITDARIAQNQKELYDLIHELRESNRQFQLILGNPSTQQDLKSISILLAQISRTIERLDNLVIGQQSDIDQIISNLRQSADNIRELTEAAKQYPSMILFGQPPNEPEVYEK
jgi:phospholipid/cholesterol/gamma-HCH transport system substrate-binding protein/paraquat-inducible protein B